MNVCRIYLLGMSCLPGVMLADSAIPEIQMYIFDEQPHSSVDQKTVPAMQMVIFSSEQTEAKPVEKAQGYRLHSEENQAGDDTAVPANHAGAWAENMAVEFYFDSGYRIDDFDWTIADPSGQPNILSELTWRNLEIVSFGIGSQLHINSNWVVDADFSYGTILDGDNQDSDYLGNDRTEEFSRSVNQADEGNVIDLSIALGYRFGLIPSSASRPFLSVMPKFGFSYHAQNLTITDGRQVIPFQGAIPGLDSSYDASWLGPWAGVDSELNFADNLRLYGSFEYHYAYYEAAATWNLREDFAQPRSFEHEAEGTGYVASLGSQLRLNRDLFLNLSVDYQRWDANKKGVDRIFFSDGTQGETVLNGVNWESMAANIGLNYRF